MRGDENGLQPDGTDSVYKRISKVEQTAEGINIVIGEIATKEEDGVYSVKRVKTDMGYSFNDEGMRVYAEGDEIENLVSNRGMYVSHISGMSSDGTVAKDYVLTADANGVDAINLTAHQYLIIGANSRLEDYDNGSDNKRTACFYIGE